MQRPTFFRPFFNLAQFLFPVFAGSFIALNLFDCAELEPCTSHEEVSEVKDLIIVIERINGNTFVS